MTPTPIADKITDPSQISGPKLNIGCGFDKREGWLNIDFQDMHAPDMVADATDLNQIDDNHAAYILAQDILEHFERSRVPTALREWNRVLKLGGLLEIRTTDVLGLVDLMRQDAWNTPEGHNQLLRSMFGTQAYKGDYHLSGFTRIYLTAELENAGFKILKMDQRDVWLLDVLVEKVSHCEPDPLFAVEDEEDFVEQAYQRYLGRPADPAGKSYWLSALADGLLRETFVVSLKAAAQEEKKP